MRPYGQRGNVALPGFRKDAEGRALCRWCDQPVPKGRRSWCSQKCVNEYRERGDWNFIRDKIVERDKVCVKCGGCRPKHDPSPISKPLLATQFRDQVWGIHSMVRYRFEVDHIVAVNDGGTDDPTNLRLLCEPCHHEVTAAQHQRWARERRGQGDLLEKVS